MTVPPRSRPAPTTDAPRHTERRGGSRCGVTPCSSPARTSDSRSGRGSPSTRSCPSRCWCWCCSPSPSIPTEDCSSGPRRACTGWRCCSAPCWRFSGRSHRGGRRQPRRPAALRARPGRDLPRQGHGGRGPAAGARGAARGRRGGAVHDGVLGGWPLLLATVGVATAGIAAAGTLYGVLAAGLRVRETLLPLLLLPVLAPVLIGSTRAFEAALAGAPADGWPWVGLLAVFAVLYIVAGVLGFGPLLEES